MDIQKYATPLTIAAAFLAIYAFTRTLKPSSEFVTGSTPQPLTVPTGASIPMISYNVATPTPPPVVPGTGYTPMIPPNGITYNKGFGVNLPADPSMNGCGTCGKSTPSNSAPAEGNGYAWNFHDTVYMNSAIL